MTAQEKDSGMEGLAKAVNDSGFPLQLGVQRIAAGNQRWQVELTEHAWRDPLTGDEKFIDLVIRNEENRVIGPMRIVIEAKRAAKTEWIFLREHEPETAHDDNRLSAVVRVLARSRTQERVLNEWFGVPFLPGSPEVSFCVIRRDGQRAQDLLEKVAAELVRAIDALTAHEDALHARQRQRAQGNWPPIARVYVPMIVTTARLFVCDAPYEHVDFESGRLEPSAMKSVAAVRFKKSFGSIAPERSNAKDITEFAEAGQRTVVVVQATHLNDLLGRWDFGNTDPYLKAALWPKSA
jgi:hypothetical protein